MERETTALQIKQAMATQLPMGLGATELLTISSVARPYVDLYAPWEQRATEQKSPDNTQEGITNGRKFETTDKMKAQVLVYPACHLIAPFDAAPLLPMMVADVCLPMLSSWVSMLWLCSY